MAEGKEEVRFLDAANRMHLGSLAVQVLSIGGKSNLKDYLGTLHKIPGFDRLMALGVIRDADAGAESAFAAVCGALRDGGFQAPPKPGIVFSSRPSVGVFIMPDGRNPGMLETLCNTAFSDRPEWRCVEEFVGCVEGSPDSSRNLDKTRAYAWLSSREKPGRGLGEAAEMGYIPFSHAAFAPLWDFLRALHDAGAG
ncbi:hypothetical protein HZA57_04375 [Candidatus Poribacteria bacterium]|nr:hypothetical protein [Candidatus Poribacteria bacterium]